MLAFNNVHCSSPRYLSSISGLQRCAFEMCHFKVTSLDSVFFKCSPLTESEIELKDQMFFIYLNSILLLNLVAHHSFPGDFASHNGGQAAAC